MNAVTYEDVMIAGGHEDANEERQALAMQKMINAGQWGFEGSMGRAMMDAIRSGVCMLGRTPARDYWGNRIPSRSEVEPGTKGSPEYVEQRMGAEWRNKMAAVK